MPTQSTEPGVCCCAVSPFFAGIPTAGSVIRGFYRQCTSGTPSLYSWLVFTNENLVVIWVVSLSVWWFSFVLVLWFIAVKLYNMPRYDLCFAWDMLVVPSFYRYKGLGVAPTWFKSPGGIANNSQPSRPESITFRVWKCVLAVLGIEPRALLTKHVL